MTALPERFLKKIKIDGDCWRWTAYKNGDGYGRFLFCGKVRFAHRVSFETLIQKVPIGFELDHKCKNRDCVNPSHLEIVTHKENVSRSNVGYKKHWTHCINGHEFTQTNTHITSVGRRRCKICLRKYVKMVAERKNEK